MADVFSDGKQSGPTEAKIKELHAKIGRLAVEKTTWISLLRLVREAHKTDPWKCQKRRP